MKGSKSATKLATPSAASSSAASASTSSTMIVTPGQKLGDIKSFVSGEGTYVLDGIIYASLVGVRTVVEPTHTPSASSAVTAPSNDPRRRLEVRSTNDTSAAGSTSSAHVIPAISDIVIGRVTKVLDRLCSLDILLCGNRLCAETFVGTIRKRDVRKFDVDSVEMYKMFRSGDIVRAEVISLGDSRSYYLSTAKNEFGVVMAQSTAGFAMIPIDWSQMICTVTNVKEYRKVAKIDGDNDTATATATDSAAAPSSAAKSAPMKLG